MSHNGALLLEFYKLLLCIKRNNFAHTSNGVFPSKHQSRRIETVWMGTPKNHKLGLNSMELAIHEYACWSAHELYRRWIDRLHYRLCLQTARINLSKEVDEVAVVYQAT